MISKHPPGYISPQVIYPHAFSREHDAGSVSPWSREMLAWLRGDTQPAAGEAILPANNVILFPANRRTGLG
ncbi:MAG: hypothetical protein V3S64_16715 [bacterium]